MMNKSDNWETHWSDYSDRTERIPSHKFRRSLIYQFLKKEKIHQCNIVDFGSGQGDLLKFISSKFSGCHLLGLELTATGVNISDKKVPNATFIQKDLLQSVEDDSRETLKQFHAYGDYGLCLEVLEHLDNPIVFLRNINYYLKPQATLIVTVPGGKMCEFERHIGHRKHYTRATLSDLLCAAGYTNFSIKAVGFPFFNLYKMVSILRGKKLIEDVKRRKSLDLSYYLTNAVMKIFDILFKFNLNVIPLGWQLIAIVKINDLR